MKRLAGVVLALACMTSVAGANVEVGGLAGLHAFSNTSGLGVGEDLDPAMENSLSNSALFGARLGVFFGNSLGVEAEGGLTPTEPRRLVFDVFAVAFRGNNHAEAAKRYEVAFGAATDVSHAAQQIDRSRDWKTVEEVNLEIQSKDYQDLEDTMAFVVKEKLIPKEVDIKAATDTSLVKDAKELLRARNISVSQVKYVNNLK